MKEITLLKAHHYTEDIRLTRIPMSRKRYEKCKQLYNADDLIEKGLLGAGHKEPQSFIHDCYLHLDQGNSPACVGNAWTHQLAAYPKVVKDLDEAFAQALYESAKRNDEYPGESYDGTSTYGGAMATKLTGKMGDFHWSFKVKSMAITIGWHKPVVVGTDWRTGMDQIDDNGFVHVTGKVRGGHEYLVRGFVMQGQVFNIDTDYFICRNSWGTSWGDDGDFKISASDMQTLLDDGGDCCVPEMMTV